MKILVVGVFDKPSSTNIFLAKALEKLGNEIIRFNYRSIESHIGTQNMNVALLFKALELSPDLVFLCKGSNIMADTVKSVNKFSKTYFWWMDPWATITDETIRTASESTYCSCTGKGVSDLFRQMGVSDPRHIFEGVDSEYYYPRSLKLDYESDISFIGTRTDERDEYLFQLGGTHPVRVYGDGYGSNVEGDEFNDIVSSSKIMLSINTQNNIPDYFSDRVFLYLACKGFVFQRYSPGLENYFVNNEHLVWFTSPYELVNLTEYWLRDNMTEKRKEIAEAGYKHVLENFTWDESARRITEVINGN